MSVFPAYAFGNDEDATEPRCTTNNFEDSSTANWLSNPSFQGLNTPRTSVEDVQHEVSSDDSVPDTLRNGPSNVEDTLPKKKVKCKKQKRYVERRCWGGEVKKKRSYEANIENVYVEDRRREKGYNNVDTLYPGARPRYVLSTKHLGFTAHGKFKKEAFKRYHTKNIDRLAKEKRKCSVIGRETTKRDSQDNSSVYPWCVDTEAEETRKVKEYNERLGQNPSDVESWLSYIEYQDILGKFQKSKPTKDTERVTIQKKLSIAEKALEKNPSSTTLLKLKLQFMGELMPGDDMLLELEKLIAKDTTCNVLLWQTLVMVTQGSVALCTVQKVLQLYSRFFTSIGRSTRMNPRAHDDRLLTMLYRCLIFLRQAGLWEQMWEIMLLNTCLNCNTSKESLRFQRVMEEKKVIEMEEVILVSKLPLNQLWLRTELLREHCNWIGVNKDHLDLIGDSRRFVLAEDVADYVHPLVMGGSNFRMAVYFLLTLKIPLLPCRDSGFTSLGLKDVEWTVDSAEALLPLVYTAAGEICGQKRSRTLLEGILDGGITSGPQYLKYHPAQETYLDFLRNTFHTIADGFTATERTCVYVWWLRFERLLIFLNKDEHPRHDPKGKKLKAILKEFFKREDNRCNLQFYREYALIEREMGRFESCVNILETAISSQDTTSPLLSTDRENCAARFSLYRTLIEVLLDAETRKEPYGHRVREVFQRMVPGGVGEGEGLSVVEQHLRLRVDEFLQKKPHENDEDDEKALMFLSNVDCDTIICYVYLLYATDRDIDEILGVLAACVDHSKECPHLQEMLYESELSLLQLHQGRTGQAHRLYQSVLRDALNSYPNNFYALSIYCNTESERPFWKFNARQTDLGLWQAIAICLILRRKLKVLQKSGNSEAATAALNKTLSFHRMLAKHPRLKSCPLLWRMYMLLLRERNLCEKIGEEVYHQSVTECPWVRGIYIDTAAVAPQLLTQIQDVIREKELRMHVTPEELDILRG